METNDLESEDESVITQSLSSLKVHRDHHLSSSWKLRQRKPRTTTFIRNQFLRAFSNDRFRASGGSFESVTDDPNWNSSDLQGRLSVMSGDRIPIIPQRKKALLQTDDESSSSHVDDFASTPDAVTNTYHDETPHIQCPNIKYVDPQRDGDNDHHGEVQKLETRYEQKPRQRLQNLTGGKATHVIGGPTSAPMNLEKSTNDLITKTIATGGMSRNKLMKTYDEKKNGCDKRAAQSVRNSSSGNTMGTRTGTSKKQSDNRDHPATRGTDLRKQSSLKKATRVMGVVVRQPATLVRQPGRLAKATRNHFRSRIAKEPQLSSKTPEEEDSNERYQGMWNDSILHLDPKHSNVKEIEMTISTIERYPRMTEPSMIGLLSKSEHLTAQTSPLMPAKTNVEGVSSVPPKTKANTVVRRRTFDPNGDDCSSEGYSVGKAGNPGLEYPKNFNPECPRNIEALDSDDFLHAFPFCCVHESDPDHHDCDAIADKRDDTPVKHTGGAGGEASDIQNYFLSDDSREFGRENEDDGILQIISSSMMNIVNDAWVDPEFFWGCVGSAIHAKPVQTSSSKGPSSEQHSARQEWNSMSKQRSHYPLSTKNEQDGFHISKVEICPTPSNSKHAPAFQKVTKTSTELLRMPIMHQRVSWTGELHQASHTRKVRRN
jgi:hypothetical protein